VAIAPLIHQMGRFRSVATGVKVGEIGSGVGNDSFGTGVPQVVQNVSPGTISDLQREQVADMASPPFRYAQRTTIGTDYLTRLSLLKST
jgi:hypothetical protein